MLNQRYHYDMVSPFVKQQHNVKDFEKTKSHNNSQEVLPGNYLLSL